MEISSAPQYRLNGSIDAIFLELSALFLSSCAQREIREEKDRSFVARHTDEAARSKQPTLDRSNKRSPDASRISLYFSISDRPMARDSVRNRVIEVEMAVETCGRGGSFREKKRFMRERALLPTRERRTMSASFL